MCVKTNYFLCCSNILRQQAETPKKEIPIAFEDSKVYSSKVVVVVVVLWDIQLEQQLKCCYISSSDKRAQQIQLCNLFHLH